MECDTGRAENVPGSREKDGGRGFQEEEGLEGAGVGEFGYVVGIVAAYGEDFAAVCLKLDVSAC